MSAIRLETKRLILRQFEIEDAEAVLRFGSHPEVTLYTGDAGEMQTIDDALDVIRNTWHADYQTHGYGRLAIELKESSEVIGFCGLKFLPEYGQPDLGYRMLPEYWGQGIATEASLAVLQHGREELGLKDIIGMVMISNIASQRVLEKLGFEAWKHDVVDGHDIAFYREVN